MRDAGERFRPFSTSIGRPARRLPDWSFLLAGTALAALGQYLFSLEARPYALLAFVLAAALFIWGARNVRWPEPATAPWNASCGNGRRWIGRIILSIALGCVATVVWQTITSDGERTVWYLYLIALLVFPLGFLIQEWAPTRAWRSSVAGRLYRNWAEIVLIALILAGAQ
jgi:tetrahydromethanopterin S-methyltransferase subunit C